MGVKHTEMINHCMMYPEEIEAGLKLYYKEIGMGRGRVDLVGVDKDGNLCIIEVKTKKPKPETLGIQLQKYYAPFRLLLGLMGVTKKIRFFLVTPKEITYLYSVTPSLPDNVGNRTKIPSSREIYGGKFSFEKLLSKVS